MPGEYRLYKDIIDLHDWTRKGILHNGPPARPAVAGNGDSEGDDEDDGFDRIEVSGGPGMPLSLYLPKRGALRTKLVDSLTPSDKSRAVVAAPQGKGKGKDQPTGKGKGKGKDKGKDATLRTCIRVREKRLAAALWRCDGVDYKGSHFPMCAFTNNVGRRSREKLTE